MRTITTASTMTINYPDNIVLSGDLNRIKITKNTTATHVEISFNLGADPFNYKENLYFLTSSVEFSLAEVLKLIYARTFDTAFTAVNSFYFTVKLYNNTSLLDTENLSIEGVYLGSRKVFDKLGEFPNLTIFDYVPTLGIDRFYYYFPVSNNIYAKLKDGSTVAIGVSIGLVYLDLTGIGDIDYIYSSVTNLMLNPTFQYLGGANYWTPQTFPSCSSSFGVNVSNKLVCVIPDESCGNLFTAVYTGGQFISGKQYTIKVTVDAVNNPSGNAQYIQFKLGGVTSPTYSGTGTFTRTLTCGAGTDLELIAYMDADTGGYGSHSFSATSIVVTDLDTNKILINEKCNGTGEKIALRFLNRFGFWRYYYVINKEEINSASSGISLLFLEDNDSEYVGLHSEQQKKDSQGLTVFREGLSKELINDFKDIIKSDYVHLYDEFNSVWIPVRVRTNSIVEKRNEHLFDVTLNILLQSNE